MIDTAALRKLRAKVNQDDTLSAIEILHAMGYTVEWLQIDHGANIRVRQGDSSCCYYPDQIRGAALDAYRWHADEIMPALLDELDAARSEILTLRARLGNIADLTTMPMPPDWTKG